MQGRVERVLKRAAAEHHPAVVISTGDALYPYGPTNISDPKFQAVFDDVYFDEPALRVPWLMTIGNHDCYGDVEAMVQYTNKSEFWMLPYRYYYVDYVLPDETTIRIVVLDTCQYVCGGGANGKNVRCEKPILRNVDPKQRNDHIEWLETVLKHHADWKIVVGHWSVFSMFGNGLFM